MKFFNSILLLTLIVGFISCSKDSDDKQPNELKDALKVTVTSSSAFVNDDSDIRVSVATHDNKANPMKWVVNGVDGTDGQVLYTVSKEYFYGGKTAVLESKSGYLTASINISAFAITKPFTITYKVEKGGKIMTQKTEAINPNTTPFTLALNY